MRVVAGSVRGRRISAPPGTDTRPTTDRVREAMFNALGSLGAVDGAVVADLFAGSGALGIEALSRGAASAHFVESDRRAVAVIEENLATLGLDDRGVVLRRPVEVALDDLPVPLDLVLADPPYAFDGWAALLADLATRLADDGLVVIESGRAVDLPPGWERVRERTYGGTVVLFARPEPPATGAPDPTGAHP
ncbi:16S rRNA (guanine(966)-N(2))-methyltransferase RsmD [Acidimicrobiia bacterium EGI L10123]|uniref:16S rRNA (guanine(966)-N(2))-methyltransferase RsmD n=1 Tax=Salinilacustrithrix flava TaxID=2957203 RepID=UPI003D7C25DA|nr:16S rRNA (guanine(966)-N(2))-methyltransferase RsmD [Acidimicrobiia bacterium EGI L10123]